MWPTSLHRAHTRLMPLYSNMTRCPAMVAKLGTGLLISIFTTLTPFNLFWRVATVANEMPRTLPYCARALPSISSDR